MRQLVGIIDTVTARWQVYVGGVFKCCLFTLGGRKRHITDCINEKVSDIIPTQNAIRNAQLWMTNQTTCNRENMVENRNKIVKRFFTLLLSLQLNWNEKRCFNLYHYWLSNSIFTALARNRHTANKLDNIWWPPSRSVLCSTFNQSQNAHIKHFTWLSTAILGSSSSWQ